MNLVIILFEAANSGPIQRNALKQATYFAEQGDSVTIVSNTFPKSTPSVRFVFSKACQRSFRLGTLLPELTFSLNGGRVIEKLIKTGKVDCCVAHGHSVSLGLVPLKKRYAVPFVVVAQSDIFNRPFGTYPLLLSIYYMICSAYAYRNANHVAVVGRHMIKRVQRFSKDLSRISVIPNGIDPDEFSFHKKQNSVTFSRKAECEILYVGRLSPEKGCSTLIRALSKIRDLDIRCTIIGDGSQKKKLERLALRLGVAEICDFKGKLQREFLGSIYKGSDIFVCPSVDEPQGVVILEAMLFCCPIVASEVGGIPDMLKHGQTGLLVAPKDPERLAVAIRRLYVDSALRTKIAQKAKVSVENFRWENVLRLFREMLVMVTSK